MFTITLADKAQAVAVVHALDEFILRCGPTEQDAFGNLVADIANALRDRANVQSQDVRDAYTKALHASA